VLGGRRVRATRYRPDPWRTPEWLVGLCGAIPAAVFLAGAGGVGLYPSTDPPVWPSVPLLYVLAVVCAVLPAVVAPPPPRALVPARVAESTASRLASGDEATSSEPEGARRARTGPIPVPEPAELPA